MIRYWPKFLSEKGNDLMVTRLRKYCRWHQKQVGIIVQLNMAMLFWYLVKSDLSSVRVYYSLHYTSHLFTRCQNNKAMFIWSVSR